MPSTLWQIQISLMSKSDVPATLRKIGLGARTVAGDVRMLNREMAVAMGTFKTFQREGNSAFDGVRRSARTFSSGVSTAARTTVSSLSQITRGAYASARAFNAMTVAANRVPRFAGAGAGYTGGGGSGFGFGTLALAAGGAAAGGALWSGIRSAADVQQMQAQLNIAGVRQSDMGRVNNLAMRMSMSTAQSVTDSTNLLKTMAVSGLNSIPGVSTLRALQALAMPIAQYADINFLNTGSKHMDFEDSAVLASGLAHDMRLYDPKRMSGFLQTLARAGYESSHGPAILGNMMRQFAPRATTYGMSPDDIVNYAALADRAGQSLRGGTGINMLLANLAAPRGKVKSRALEEMGIYNPDGTSRFVNEKTGAVNFQGFLQYVASYRDRMRLQGKGALANRLEQRGFDTNAARLLDAIGTTQMVGKGGMLDTMRTNEAHSMTLQQMQERLMVGLNSQTRLLTTNFQTLMQTIANPLIPSLSSLVHNLADLTGNLALYFNAHPNQAKFAALGLGGVAAAGSIAALAVSGYVTSAVLGRVAPGIGRALGGEALTSAIAHAAGGSAARFGALGVAGRIAGLGLGLGAIPAIGKGLQGAGGFAMGALRAVPGSAAIGGLVRAAPGVDGLMSAFSRLGGGFRIIATLGEMAATHVSLFAEGIARIGLRAVPVVGEIFMLADAVHFFFSHSKDVGYYLGKAARWMADEIPKLLKGAGPKLFDAMKGLVGYLLGALDPRNWWSAFQNFKSGVVAGFTPDKTTAPPHIKGHAAGGYVASQGLGYIHAGEVIVKHPTVKKLERMVSSRGNRGGPIVFQVSSNYAAPAGESDSMHRRRSKRMARDLAHKVAEILHDELGFDLNSGSSTPQLAGHSVHAMLTGVPS